MPPPRKISQLNTRSILPKIDSLRLLMKDNPYGVFSVSETWLEPSISNAKISLAGCSVVRMDRCEKIGGGTAIYVCDSLPFKTHSDLRINELENCMIEVLRPKTKKLFICCVYRAPNKPLENYINQLNSVILKLPNDSELILLGDFNVHLSTNSRSPSRQMLNNFSRQLHIDQVITEPTRITETSQTMIVQNKDAKSILDVPCLSFSTEAIDKLYWHPLSHRRYLHRLLTIFKIKNNLTKFNFGLPNTNHTSSSFNIL